MPPAGTLEIDLDAFAARPPGSPVIDVHEPAEYLAGHVPDAVLIPLGELGARIGQVPQGRTVSVICASGNRSLRAAEALVTAGYDAVSVAGGTSAWARSGRPITTGSNPS